LSRTRIKSWPVIGWLARAGGTPFIEIRRRADGRRAGECRRPNRARWRALVVVFPKERVRRQTVLPFKSSLLEPATRKFIPFLSLIQYELEMAPRAKMFVIGRRDFFRTC